jgi:hypothetical protein
MEQPCYKCGQVVEQGIPFCPHCSAPQIRVVVAEPAPALAAAADGGPVTQSPASQTVPVLALPMRWSQALRPCVLAAVIAFPIGLLSQSFIIAMLAAGFLAVIFNGRRSGIPLRASEAAKLGALAGVFCSGILLLLIACAVTVPDARSKMQDQYVQSAQKVAAWFPSDPDIQASIDQLKTSQGFAKALIWASVFLFFFSIPLAGLGGILGRAVLGLRDGS